jgi:peptide/nickel transport system permease protein
MKTFIADRLLRLFVVVIGAAIMAFVLLRLSGDPSTVLLPIFATPAERLQLRHQYGLDQPLPIQFLDYTFSIMHGNFGQSWQYREPALQVVLGRFPNTLELAGISMFAAVVFGMTLGIIGAARSGGLVDSLLTIVSLGARAIPSFWLGTIFILFFALKLGWFPTSGIGGLSHLVLPALTIAFLFIGEVATIVRASMVEALGTDYVRTALAKGLPMRTILLRHALRNALNPVISVVAVDFGLLLGGTVIVENVFAWPGIGTLAVQSVGATDYPVLQAIVLFLALSVAFVSTVADIVYGFVDPRIRRAA